MREVNQNQLHLWLEQMCYKPKFGEFASTEAAFAEMYAVRNGAIAEMCEVGASALFPIVIPLLTSIDAENRCLACKILMSVDAQRGIESVIPMLDDSRGGVRVYACECIREFGGRTGVPFLLKVLQSHSDPAMRVSAAGGLGRNGGPDVLPALLQAMESDHEVDGLGYTASHSASMAIDSILGTDETCLHFGNVCRMLDHEHDLDRLRQLAEDRYKLWQETGS